MQGTLNSGKCVDIVMKSCNYIDRQSVGNKLKANEYEKTISKPDVP